MFIWINLGTLKRWMYGVRKELEPVENLKQNIFLCWATWYYGVLFLNCSSCPSLLVSTDMFLKLINKKGTWWFSFKNCLLHQSAGVGTIWFPRWFGNHYNWCCLQTVVQERATFSCDVEGVALQKLLRVKKLPKGHKNSARCQRCSFRLTNLHYSCLFSVCAIYPRI